MRLNTAAGGAAERMLRAELRRRGFRVESHVSGLPGSPDVVLKSARVCVFCDGDFWHGRDWGRLQTELARRANAAYWLAKIGRNRARDSAQTRALRAAGWTVARLWETDILRSPEKAVDRINRVLRAAGN